MPRRSHAGRGQEFARLTSAVALALVQVLGSPHVADRYVVHAFRPCWTGRDKDGRRFRRYAKTWNYRFSFRGTEYTGGDRYGTKRAAIEAGEKRRDALRGGQVDDPWKITFAGLEERTKAAYVNAKPGTAHAVRYAFERMRPFFGSYPVMEIARDPMVAERYLAYRRSKGGSDATTALDFAFLARGLRLLRKLQPLIPEPEFPEVKRVWRTVFFRPDELERLLAHVAPWYRNYYAAADEMGWRANSELKTRLWERHVDWGPASWDCDRCRTRQREDVCPECGAGRPGWVRLEASETKEGEPRLFPMTARLRTILTAQRAYVDAIEKKHGCIIANVFCRPNGKPLGADRDAFHAACSRAGLGDKRPHDLRRTAAMRFDELLSRAEAMAMGGWKSEQTFKQYVQVDARALRRAGAALDRADREQAPPKVVPLKKAGEEG